MKNSISEDDIKTAATAVKRLRAGEDLTDFELRVGFRVCDTIAAQVRAFGDGSDNLYVIVSRKFRDSAERFAEFMMSRGLS